jgi:cysteine synthase
MAESFSIERRKTMRMLGAKVVLTPAGDRGTGMVKKAKELAAEHGWFWARQFENDANPAFHAQTTGPEILSDFAGKDLDYWVTGYGTGGTLQGAGKVIRAARPNVRIVVTEPDTAPILASLRDGTPQERLDDGSSAQSHPAWVPHPIQGWTPDFVPIITEDALAMNLIDDIVPVSGEEAMKTSQRLASEEGIFTGISGGASMLAALKVAEQAPEGSTILTMLPDTGERYLSTPLFAAIDADMNEGEVEVSRSTPNYQL